MIDKVPHELQQAFLGLLALIPTATLSRILLHYQMVRMGQRKFWSGALFWEVPTAMFCAIIGGGLAQYLGATDLVAQAVVGVVAWMGPRGMEVAVIRWLEKVKK